MKHRGFSLRFKILALLTTVPVLTLAAYMFMALHIFTADKVAYVFDASSNMTGAVAAQIKVQLNSTLNLARPIFQDFLSRWTLPTLNSSSAQPAADQARIDGAPEVGSNPAGAGTGLVNAPGAGPASFGPEAERLFRAEPSLEVIAVLRGAETTRRLAGLEKEPGQLDEFFQRSAQEVAAGVSAALQRGRAFRVPFGDDRVALFEAWGEGDARLVFVAVARLSEIFELFKTASSQSLFLSDAEGRLYFAPDRSGGQSFGDLYHVSFLSQGHQMVAQGAETAADGQGQAHLISYSKVGYGDLIVISTVPKEKALGAVTALVRKSLVFFGILVSLTAIVSLIASGRLTQALSALFAATQRVSEGKFDISVQVRSSDEVGALADNFNLMAKEVARLVRQTAEKARMESEIQTARTVQETLFPQPRQRLDGLEIAGFYEPASECGGDWWHYCKIGSQYFFWIGDATGHGVPAALMTSAAKSAATVIESLTMGPAQAMGILNRAICEVSKGKLMMTFFLASYDAGTKTLRYANASHEAPFLIRRGVGPLTRKNLIPLLDVNNPRLGQAMETTFQEGQIQLEPGDSLFFYTDGVMDIRSKGQEAWGERAFLKALVAAHNHSTSASAAVQEFTNAFQSFRQGEHLVDDVTFFIVKNDGTGEVPSNGKA